MDTENQKDIADIAEEEIEKIREAEREKERERILEQHKAKERARKRKLLPPFMMLLAGAIVSITMFVSHYKLRDMLIILLCVLIVFYLSGEVIKWMFERFEAQLEQARMDEGEVIEKEPDEDAGDGLAAAARTEGMGEGNG